MEKPLFLASTAPLWLSTKLTTLGLVTVSLKWSLAWQSRQKILRFWSTYEAKWIYLQNYCNFGCYSWTCRCQAFCHWWCEPIQTCCKTLFKNSVFSYPNAEITSYPTLWTFVLKFDPKYATQICGNGTVAGYLDLPIDEYIHALFCPWKKSWILRIDNGKIPWSFISPVR